MPDAAWQRVEEKCGLMEMEVVNATRGTVLGSRIRVADNAWSRAVGLLADRGLDPGSGLWLDPCSGIHTVGMRFAIDVIALDRALRVRGLWERLGRFRIAAVSWRTKCVLELPCGVIRQSDTQVGDQLELRR
jgi:uncharacterized membrane protein (UPF0127 family)